MKRIMAVPCSQLKGEITESIDGRLRPRDKGVGEGKTQWRGLDTSALIGHTTLYYNKMFHSVDIHAIVECTLVNS